MSPNLTGHSDLFPVLVREDVTLPASHGQGRPPRRSHGLSFVFGMLSMFSSLFTLDLAPLCQGDTDIICKYTINA